MSETCRVGQRGQVTIPKELRERLNITGGDDVVVREEDGRIVIERPVTRDDLADGYRERAERDRRLADELDDISSETDRGLGDAPRWE